MSDPILKRIFNLIYPVGSIYMSAYGKTGEGSSMPPYLVVNIWKRIS